MSKNVRIAIFKLIDILVILTMVLASPMNVAAAAMAQDSVPSLETDKADYAPGESATVTGSGFAADNYVLVAKEADGSPKIWETLSITIADNGNFESDSPTLVEGSYEIRVYAAGWEENKDWEAEPVANVTFTVTAPPPPTATPTEEPTEEPTATQTPTDEPTPEPTNTRTDEPTVETSNTPTERPTKTPTDEPTATQTPTDEPTAEPTNTPTDKPTDTPTDEPTTEPTSTPTDRPTRTP